MKKVVSFILSLLLMFSIATSAMAAPAKEKLRQDSAERPSLRTITKLKADIRTKDIKDNDQVRVIVELKGKPAIEYATEKGLKVTQLDAAYLKSITDGIIREQNNVKSQIASNQIAAKYHYSFSNVANGFSATVTYGDAKKIEAMPGVERVVIANEYQRPEPNTGTSKDIIKATETWNLGFNGQGTVISIIDTGIDYDHKDMRLTDASKAKLNPQSVSSIIAANGLKGKWYTAKVPYGYNYYDNNDIVKDLGPGASMHGMHVAGISAANGNDATGIKGVAPEAQLLAMKVFSNDPKFASTFADVYLAAIEDSIKLGADTINMSLGSTAGFQRPDDPEQVALTKATRNGIVLAISAGNSGNIGYGFQYAPYAKNPDLGVVGSPGLNADSIQVASIENTNIYADAIRYKNGLIGYTMAGANNPISAFSGQLEYVDCKLGLIGTDKGVPVDDFAGVNVAGKIALIMRGGYTDIPGNFVDKIMNAQNKGAAGVIVYNHISGGEALLNMAYPDGGTIPAVFIGYKGGTNLKALIATGENKVQFTGEKISVGNPNSGKMSDFSSWGATPNLDFKPELTAPGGSIYSTLNDNSYGIMSGTSMAAPHVAGGSSLILQRVDKDFHLTGYNRSLMAKNLLLSTAVPAVDKGLYNNYYNLGNYVSPRIQGAGVMNLQAAATTPAIVTDSSTGISKVTLKEMGNTNTFRLKVTNFGNKPLTYKISGTVTTNLVIDGEIQGETQGVYEDGTISSKRPWLGKFPISYAQNGAPISSITVPANGIAEFDVTVDLTNAIDWVDNIPIGQIFENGAFIEGFVKLTLADDTQPAIGIPYMGFYGEWDKAPIIDDNIYDPEAMPFYDYITGLAWLNEAEKMYNFLGVDFNGVPNADNIAFSPNGDGIADKVRFVGTLLRNARALEVNILDKDGNLIKALSKDYDLRKNFYYAGNGSIYTAYESWVWDGTVGYNKPAPDGEYIYQVRAKIDFENADWQEVRFPVKVDTQAPVIEDFNYDPAAKQITVSAKDNNAICYYELIKDGAAVAANDTGVFDISKLIDPNQRNIFVVKVHDFAENTVEVTKEFNPGNDTEAPVIYVDAPEVLGIYNTNQVITSGYLTDNSQIREFRINGEIVPTNYNAEKKQYAFEKILTIPDGSFRIKYEATDIAGNKMSIERKIFVDTTAPVINLSIPETVGPEVDKLQITGTVTDNMPGLKVFVNGNIVYNSNSEWMYIEGECPVTYDFSDCAPINLEFGPNTIVVEGKDDAGNNSVQEYTVYRNTEAEVPVSIVNATVTPNRNITVLNPAVLSATASSAVDWEVTIKDYRGVVVETYTALGTTSFNATWTPTAEQVKYGKFFVEFKTSRGTKTDVVNMIITTKVPLR